MTALSLYPTLSNALYVVGLTYVSLKERLPLSRNKQAIITLLKNFKIKELFHIHCKNCKIFSKLRKKFYKLF